MTTRVVILGGGFGGVYAALGLAHAEAGAVDVTVIDRNNFFLFTPMLSEIAASSIDTRHIVNPTRRLLPHARFMEAEVTGVDFAGKSVKVELPTGESDTVPYDHLVVALGSVTNYFHLPGVQEHAVSLKTLADAIALRNRVIQRLEEADVTPPDQREELLTFVVAGGNLAGVEVTGDLNDFVRDASKSYRHVRPGEIRVILVEKSGKLLGDLPGKLPQYAHETLIQRGVEVHVNAGVEKATDRTVDVSGVGTIPTRNLIWTAGVAPTPFVRSLGLPLEKGRICADACMRVEGHDGVWAIGDVAAIPDGHGGFYPMTAQHAIREGSHLAKNIQAVLTGETPTPFTYRTMGMLATVGHQVGVGDIMGFRVSGFLAWWMWRSYYLFRLPRFEKRLRVVLDWTLDLLFPRDIVQLKMGQSTQSAGEADAHSGGAR